LITEATADDRAVLNPTQQLADIVLRLRNQFIDRQLGLLTQQGARPELSEGEQIELVHQQQALRQSKRQPLSALGGSVDEPF
jgi:hypothetical protein